LEHNFGHGKKHLSSLLATMNLLAFGLHTLLLRARIGVMRSFFDHIRTLTACLDIEDWAHLMDFMMRGLKIGPHVAQKNQAPGCRTFSVPGHGSAVLCRKPSGSGLEARTFARHPLPGRFRAPAPSVLTYSVSHNGNSWGKMAVFRPHF